MLNDRAQFIERAFIQRVDRRVDYRDDGDARTNLVRVVLHAEVAPVRQYALRFADTLQHPPRVDRTLELRNRFRIAQSGRVADWLIFNERAHHAAHVLAAARLGKLRHLEKFLGDRDGPLLCTHEFSETTTIIHRDAATGRRGHECEWREPLLLVRRTNDDDVADRRIGVDLLVAQDCAFDLFGAHAMTGHVDDVIAPSVQREAAVGVADGDITLRIRPSILPTRPVGCAVARDVAAPCRRNTVTLDRKVGAVTPDCAREIREWGRDDDLPFLAIFGAAPTHTTIRSRLAIGRPDITLNPWQWVGVCIGAQRKFRVAVKVRPDNAAMFGGPVRVDVLRAHQIHTELLHGRRHRFGAECRDTQRGEIVAAHVVSILWIRHHDLEKRDPSLEDRHAIPLDDRCEAARTRKDRSTLGKHRRHSRGECGRNHVALARDPTRIGDDIHHIARTRVERNAHRVRNAGDIPAVHMHDALGFPRRAGGVDEEERKLGVDRHWRRGRPQGANARRVVECSYRGDIRHVDSDCPRTGK